VKSQLLRTVVKAGAFIYVNIQLKRVYQAASPGDGYRLLVDCIWPRGLGKQEARIDDWMKEIAPSTELRKWFGHEPAKWAEFRRRYFAELSDRPDLVERLVEMARGAPLTLVYSAKDEEHNNAVALREYLERR
jgi:uncharacterized protein YeaO (DUF488 family)